MRHTSISVPETPDRTAGKPGPVADRPLAVTAGEPAGIGPELCLALADSRWSQNLVVIADPEMLAARASALGRHFSMREFDPARPRIDPARPRIAPLRRGELQVLPHKLPRASVCGAPDPANARSLLDGLREAVHGCQSGLFSGLVTAPLQKSVINEAGIAFTGHTEFLAELLGAKTPVMLLVAGTLRVALASTHLPLKEVPAYLTRDRLRQVIEVLHDDLERRFRIAAPRIHVCGLNPHAGEGGYLGTEERDVLKPVVDELRQRGFDLKGPLPADTAFTPAAGPADAILAMYHDQGLPVLKYAGFGTAVNVTLGLPIVRTSVDHGTALDIAGQGKADAGSLLAAVELALQLARSADGTVVA